MLPWKPASVITLESFSASSSLAACWLCPCMPIWPVASTLRRSSQVPSGKRAVASRSSSSMPTVFFLRWARKPAAPALSCNCWRSEATCAASPRIAATLSCMVASATSRLCRHSRPASSNSSTTPAARIRLSRRRGCARRGRCSGGSRFTPRRSSAAATSTASTAMPCARRRASNGSTPVRTAATSSAWQRPAGVPEFSSRTA